MSSSLNQQIAELQTEIDSLTAEINNIQNATLPEGIVADCINKRKEELKSKKFITQNHKTSLETKLANQTTGFNTEQQNTIDAINTLFPNKFKRKLDKFSKAAETKKTEFFTNYALCNTDFIKEQFLISYR